MTDLFLVLIIGVIAGVMAGMFGIGGGVVMVPAMIVFLGFSIVEANGTSLAALMMPVGIFAVIQYYKNKYVDLKLAAIFALGLLLGVLFGAKFAIALPSDILKQLYGIFLLYVSWRFFEFKTKNKNSSLNSEDISSEKKHSFFVLILIGISAGILSGMFGIGGGLVMVPMMVTLMKFNPKKAVGTSLAALLLPVALPGVLEYYKTGNLRIETAAILAVGLVVGSILGAKITISLPTKTIKRIYAIFLLIVGMDFLIRGLLNFFKS
ncbi:MAG: sulfite exporter TauE/SafE family protein [Candidatus Kapabacteria bacterium]|nr:sulfite exporter TauE/SafE family protein [Candidatus Kapabacteria bacterium]